MSSYEFADRRPNNIIFFNTVEEKQVEVLRNSKEGITANPDVPVDEAAQAVIRALNGSIESMVERASKRLVGLTLQEVSDIWDGMGTWNSTSAQHFYNAIWKAIKEKNI